ncbi:MAG: NUDIX hydrolase [Thermodesulfobacteriota bacterium]
MHCPYTPIIATLGFVLSPDRRQTLLVHRTARADDQHLGKFNGLGGKMRPDEDVAGCMRREIREEAGIECLAMVLRGTINWPNFGKNGEDWLGFIFRIDRFSGQPFRENREGMLSWQPVALLHTLPMWPGDRHFLPLVFDDNPAIFHGAMPYQNGQPVSWHFERL